MRIKPRTGDPVTDLALDLFVKKKQGLVFVNTRRSAEACAERIAKAVKKHLTIATRRKIASTAKNALSSPTEQCKRLSKSLKHQSAFPHIGLHSKQRTLVEESFKRGDIRIICATPTLAAGLDMPAYRVVVRDLQRYSGGWGMQPIPVLEYEQMSGRAGRPSYDDVGEAITIAKTGGEKNDIIKEYIHGDPEDIQSKLASRPVLRTYVLSLVAARFVDSEDALQDFMSDTFYAHQYGDSHELQSIISNVTQNLREWDMLKGKTETTGFVSASEYTAGQSLEATRLGKRVSELYLDPLTGKHIAERIKKYEDHSTFSLLHALVYTLEMRPYSRVKKADKNRVEAKLLRVEDELLVEPPKPFEEDYREFLNSVKTAMVLEEWIEETGESEIHEGFGVTPGELQARRSDAEWLAYSAREINKIVQNQSVRKPLKKLETRIKQGVKEELLALTRFKGIGRVRARRLQNAGVKDAGDVKRIDAQKLQDILGSKTAVKVKKQVGQTIQEVQPEQHGNLLDYQS